VGEAQVEGLPGQIVAHVALHDNAPPPSSPSTPSLPSSPQVQNIQLLVTGGQNCCLVTRLDDGSGQSVLTPSVLALPIPAAFAPPASHAPFTHSPCLAFAMLNLRRFILILCNAIGSPVDTKYIDFEPQLACMSATHVVVASDSVVFVWNYRSAPDAGPHALAGRRLWQPRRAHSKSGGPVGCAVETAFVQLFTARALARSYRLCSVTGGRGGGGHACADGAGPRGRVLHRRPDHRSGPRALPQAGDVGGAGGREENKQRDKHVTTCAQWTCCLGLTTMSPCLRQRPCLPSSNSDLFARVVMRVA